MPRITITVEGKVPQPYRFDLDRELVTLGRDDNNDILVDCGSVSMHHAVMQRVHGGYELMDKGSTNGIKLDGEYRQVIDLKNNQAVMLGDVVFDFVLSDEELEELAREEASSAPPVDPASQLPPMPNAQESSSPSLSSSPSSPSLPSLPTWPDEEPEEPEELRMPAKRPEFQAPPTYMSAGAQPQGGSNVMVWVIAVIAFVVGMEVHYRKDMGSSMIGGIYGKFLSGGPEAPAKDSSTESN